LEKILSELYWLCPGVEEYYTACHSTTLGPKDMLLMSFLQFRKKKKNRLNTKLIYTIIFHIHMKNKILKLISEIEELIATKPKTDEIKATTNINSRSVIDKYNFKSLKDSNYQRILSSKIEFLKEYVYKAGNDYSNNKSKEKHLVELFVAANNLKTDEIKVLKDNLSKIKFLVSELRLTPITPEGELKFNIPTKIPQDIKEEVMLDINELRNAFNSNCYRASIILCARVLETCLHRKYFEVTGNDLLEKAPGIGLGNLIGKMRDKGITLDPGLMQQVHLLNNIRIYSVHKKKEMFLPSKQQTYATILYTTDIVGRLF
jgi:hypothetical protein